MGRKTVQVGVFQPPPPAPKEGAWRIIRNEKFSTTATDWHTKMKNFYDDEAKFMRSCNAFKKGYTKWQMYGPGTARVLAQYFDGYTWVTLEDWIKP